MSISSLNHPCIFDRLTKKIRLQPLEICLGFHNNLHTVLSSLKMYKFIPFQV